MSEDIQVLIFILILSGIAIFLLWFFIFKVKHLKTPDVFAVDGGVKTGKSELTVMLGVKQVRKNIFKWFVKNKIFLKIGNLFRRIFKKPFKPEKLKPMIYSNMPLNHVKYNEFTLDILFRRVRIPDGSVCIIDEASLLADSMSGVLTDRQKKEEFDRTNEALTLFIKLYGHYSHGGSLFYNSQQIIDLHFSFKRCTSTYLFIMKRRKYPFFSLLNVRECVHTEDNDMINTFEKDVDELDKPLFVSNRWFKYYDRFYLSSLTDDLKMAVDYDVIKYIKGKNLKAKRILTIGNYKSIRDFNSRNEVVKNETNKA